MDRLVSLPDYIAATVAQPFSWAESNCALWAAGAVAACVGFDPVADLRGRFDRPFDWRQFVQAQGGMISFVRSRMAVCPAPVRQAEGLPDGVALVRLDGQVLCGVLLSHRLIVRMAKGLRVADDFETIEVWTW